jgi:putative ABC transport system permease protein
VAVNAALSIRFRLGLERRLLIAAARMIVQLFMVGLVLKALFAAASPWLTGGAVLVMVVFAGYERVRRVRSPAAGPTASAPAA